MGKEVATDRNAQIKFIRELDVLFAAIYDRPRGCLVVRVSCRGQGVTDVRDEYIDKTTPGSIGDGFDRALRRLMKDAVSDRKDS